MRHRLDGRTQTLRVPAGDLRLAYGPGRIRSTWWTGVTAAKDGGTASHFPVQCSKCGGTHLLAERPSLTCSPRIYCQHCGTLVRLRRCRCVTCGNFLEKCDCRQRLSGQANRQLSIRESLFGSAEANRARPSSAGSSAGPHNGAFPAPPTQRTRRRPPRASAAGS